MKVREVISKDVLVASPDDTIEKAATLWRKLTAEFFCRGNGRLVGMVTDRDITPRYEVRVSTEATTRNMRQGRRGSNPRASAVTDRVSRPAPPCQL